MWVQVALIRSLMGATWPHNILGKWGYVAPSENPEEQPIFIPEKPEPIPANDTLQEGERMGPAGTYSLSEHGGGVSFWYTQKPIDLMRHRA